MDTVQATKRFEIIGEESRHRKAIQAPTDISVLVVGKAGRKGKYPKNYTLTFS
jgi:hypothetical protein